MSRNDIRELTRALSFKPFRVFVSNGETYDILHPDMIIASDDSVHLGYSKNENAGDDFDRVRIVGLNHVVKIETITASRSEPTKSTAA